MTDADYQGNEYQYQNPEYFDPTDLPDVDFTDTVPKGTCYELWVDLFGNSTGAFIPTASQWAKLSEYQKKCPLIYMPHYCCSSSTVTDSFVGVNGPVTRNVTNIKIHGPSSVKVNESAEYSVSGGLTGCAYEMDATNGNMIGSTFYAPSTAGSAEIFVKPWMSDDQDKRCDTKVVTITDEAVCDGKIGYTTLQMSVGDSQTLIVTGSSGGTYGWAASSGSIDATGLSVTYTAPSSNANCSSNPTITLTCGGNVVDTLQISINAYTNMGRAAFRQICTGGPAYNTTNCDNQGEYPICYVSFRVYDCLGRDMRALNGYPDETCSIAMSVAQQGGPDSCINSACADVDPGTPGCSCGWSEGVIYDVRTSDMIVGGCCPIDLL